MARHFDDRNIVATFSTITQPNEFESLKQGRPIFDEMEVVEIRVGGDMQNRPVFPAHDGINIPQEDGTTVYVTYAERFPKQYQKFKEGKVQTKDGTPLEEAPFLTAKQRSELKGLQIFTVDQLAALDDRRLKSLGMYGRDLMNKAQAFIAAATGSADLTRLASENAELRALIAKLQQQEAAERIEIIAEDTEEETARDDPGFETWEPEDIKAYIKEETGQAPRGNPSKETLVQTAIELYKSGK